MLVLMSISRYAVRFVVVLTLGVWCTSALAQAGSGSSREVRPPAATSGVGAPLFVSGGPAPWVPARLGLRRDFPVVADPAPEAPGAISGPPSDPPPVAPAAPPDVPPPPTLAERFDAANRALDDGRTEDAVAELQKLAALDHPGALTNLGNLYLLGRGVAKSPEQAAAWYRRAVARDSASARYNLGQLHQSGTGVPRSIPEAVRLYREASERGFDKADIALAKLWIAGSAKPASEDERERVLESASSQGDPVVKAYLENAPEPEQPAVLRTSPSADRPLSR